MKTLSVYQFNELSDDAKQRAIEDYRDRNYEIQGSHEMFDSLEALFEKCSDVSLGRYELGLSQSWLRVSFEQNIDDFSGKRAMAWLENNLLSKLRIPWTSYRIQNRRRELAKYGKSYRAGMIKPCPFTGICYDDDFLYALQKSIREGDTLKEAFEGLACEYQRTLNAEYEYENSDEYIREALGNELHEFFEDGRMV